MRGLFWVVALFAAAVGLSLVARYNDGYVLIFIAPKRIEMTLTLFIVLLVAAFVLLYVFVRAAAYTLRLPDMVREFRADRQRERARRALFEALVNSFEGRFSRALRSAAAAHEAGEEPALAALVAARAAHALAQGEERDRWLERARTAPTGGDSRAMTHAALMTQAELLADEHRDAEALAVLAELNRSGARHIATQRLALKSMLRAGAWEDALKVARRLEEHHAILPEVAARMRETAYAGLFDSADPATLRERLRKLPRGERRMVPVARTVARALVGAGLVDEALDIACLALDEAWDDALGLLHAECAAARPDALERMERWRLRYPREPGLLLALGLQCAAAGLWGKAQEYLELSIAQRPCRRAHVELARVFEAASRESEAARQYRLAALAQA
jgi:HemY protein